MSTAATTVPSASDCTVVTTRLIDAPCEPVFRSLVVPANEQNFDRIEIAQMSSTPKHP